MRVRKSEREKREWINQQYCRFWKPAGSARFHQVLKEGSKVLPSFFCPSTSYWKRSDAEEAKSNRALISLDPESSAVGRRLSD